MKNFDAQALYNISITMLLITSSIITFRRKPFNRLVLYGIVKVETVQSAAPDNSATGEKENIAANSSVQAGKSDAKQKAFSYFPLWIAGFVS